LVAGSIPAGRTQPLDLHSRRYDDAPAGCIPLDASQSDTAAGPQPTDRSASKPLNGPDHRPNHRAALDSLDDLRRDLRVIELDETVTRCAAERADPHALRGCDAVHCAAANRIDAPDLVASGDKELLRACTELATALPGKGTRCGLSKRASRRTSTALTTLRAGSRLRWCRWARRWPPGPVRRPSRRPAATAPPRRGRQPGSVPTRRAVRLLWWVRQ
jgi:hypothetical protein